MSTIASFWSRSVQCFENYKRIIMLLSNSGSLLMLRLYISWGLRWYLKPTTRLQLIFVYMFQCQSVLNHRHRINRRYVKELLQIIVLNNHGASPKSAGEAVGKGRLKLTAQAEATIHRWDFFFQVSLSSTFEEGLSHQLIQAHWIIWDNLPYLESVIMNYSHIYRIPSEQHLDSCPIE